MTDDNFSVGLYFSAAGQETHLFSRVLFLRKGKLFQNVNKITCIVL